LLRGTKQTGANAEKTRQNTALYEGDGRGWDDSMTLRLF
jgi:hypothetical protein